VRVAMSMAQMNVTNRLRFRDRERHAQRHDPHRQRSVEAHRVPQRHDVNSFDRSLPGNVYGDID